MALLERQVMIHVDSASPDQNLNDLGSSFTVELNPPLLVPEDAVDAWLGVDEVLAQYTIPNLSVGSTTDVFSYSYDGTKFTHNIEEGIYGLEDVVDMMNRFASLDGVGIGYDQPLFSALPISATQKVAIGVFHQDSTGSVILHFSEMAGLAALLGFDPATDITFTASASVEGTIEYKVADNIATFSALTYLLLESSLPLRNVDPRGKSSSTLVVIPIDVAPGSQLLFRPYNLVKHDARALIGSEISNITFSLKNNSRQLVSTMGESWSAVLRLVYTVKV